jgi:hypothetical protein
MAVNEGFFSTDGFFDRCASITRGSTTIVVSSKTAANAMIDLARNFISGPSRFGLKVLEWLEQASEAFFGATG